jgi:hypothetical protein
MAKVANHSSPGPLQDNEQIEDLEEHLASYPTFQVSQSNWTESDEPEHQPNGSENDDSDSTEEDVKDEEL